MHRGPASLCRLWACMALVLASGSVLRANPSRFPDTAAAIPFQPAFEEELLTLVNRNRAARNIPPLEVDGQLVQIAREQSQRMAAARLVSHELPDAGSLGARLIGAGYAYRSARENVARAATVPDVQEALSTSAGHLRNMLATDVTHVGIGIVRGAGPNGDDLYVTEIFCDPATLLPAEAIRDAFVALVRESRSENGLEPLPADPVFVQAAMDSLVDLESSIEGDALRRLMSEAVANLRQAKPGMRAPARVAVDVQLVRDMRDLKLPGHVLQRNATAFGTGAFEARDASARPVVVLLSLICLEQ